MTDNHIVVVCSADNGYAMPLAVTLRSSVENIKSDRKIKFYILDGGIKESNKRRILKSLPKDKAEVNFIQNADKSLGKIQVLSQFVDDDGFKEPSYITRAAYYRLLIPELLPTSHERAIYLDCDLVVRGDLTEIWKTDMKSNHLLAVRNTLPNPHYFNTGVLLLDLNLWRRDNISIRSIEYLKNHRDHIRFWDQDVLNTILANQWFELDLRWNVTPNFFLSLEQRKQAQPNPFVLSQKTASITLEDIQQIVFENPYIIHYATASKPWNTLRTSFPKEFKFKDIFFDYLDLTEWSGWRLTHWELLKAKISRKVRASRLWISRQRIGNRTIMR